MHRMKVFFEFRWAGFSAQIWKVEPAMPRILRSRSPVEDEPRLIDQLDIPLGKPIELAVWSVKKAGIRCKVIPSQLPVTFRMVRHEVEGEIITVIPSKVWQFKNTVYIAGKTINRRIDAASLGLEPLKLEEQGLFEPDKETDLIEENDPFAKYYLPIMAYGPRHEYEMEQVIPFEDPDDWDSDPITRAADAFETGDKLTAYQMMAEILAEDLRCIDAHAHLGNWEFNASDSSFDFREERATRHYEAGIRIAELSFDKNFHGLLPWGHIDNRPYLRCLHGYGLCLWRTGKTDAAREIFDKMLWLNPRDNQGARFLLADIDAGRSWQEMQDKEDKLA